MFAVASLEIRFRFVAIASSVDGLADSRVLWVAFDALVIKIPLQCLEKSLGCLKFNERAQANIQWLSRLAESR